MDAAVATQLIWAGFWLIVVVVVLLVFKGPLGGLVSRMRTAEGSLSISLKNGFHADLRKLELDAERAEEEAQASSPSPAVVESVNIAFRQDKEERTPDSGEQASTRDLLRLGAEWGVLLDDVRGLFARFHLDEPEDESSVGEWFAELDRQRTGILPNNAQHLALTADRLMEDLMRAAPGDFSGNEVDRFVKSLASLRRIVDISISKLRHPGNALRWTGPDSTGVHPG